MFIVATICLAVRGAVPGASRTASDLRVEGAARRLATRLKTTRTLVPSPAALAPRTLVYDASASSASGLACVGRQLQSGDGHVLIEAIGDSITRGHRLAWWATYPAVLQALLQKRFPKANLTVHNSGFNGASLDLLSACLQRMASTSADVVLIQVRVRV